MESPMRHTPVPMPAPPRQQQDAIAAGALHHVMALSTPPAAAAAMATAMAEREQCPRCASRDTKFCYFNNYNTAQPRHFCRACRRYWTLGGSLRNVPVGGSTRRKRPRPARPTRALAAAVANAASSSVATTTTTANSSSCGPLAPPLAAPGPAPALTGGLLSSLLLGSAPQLEGRLGFDLGLGQPAVATGAGDYLAQLGFGAGPLLWPVTTVLEGDRTSPAWKAGAGMFPPSAAALWQEEELAAAPPMDHAGGQLLHQHHGVPPLLL